ncbi:LysR family transcriptional regulator [Marinobacterium arenosum]|uniref:LysR family transcriptional regulator n=1 Tax=Marinobacterium arenosum TaxID=2862496 RepID=UPI001C95ABDB|nr:LysR family transcriptional regulator [Marinobacterium arenosum]MBY4679075.1 LysR family transcriptional regulator [Marinobacterium arenosum]
MSRPASRPAKSLIGQISDIDLRLLKVFRTVVEAGGFAQAEVELGVSASAISISMADLEKRLGLRLCQRGRAGFSLTDEGRQVYDASLQLFTSLESFRSEIHSIHRQLKGELAIGITDNLVSMPRMRITYALRSLKQQGPEVNIRIRMISPTEVELGILDGKLHIGVVPLVQPLKGLEYTNLYAEEALLYCSHEHPLFDLPDAEIDREALADCDAIEPTFARTEQVNQQLQQLSTTASASDREGVAFLIMTGLYIGFLPTHYAERWVREGRLRALRPELMNYQIQYAAVTRKGVRPNLVLETFLNELALHAED